MENANDRKIQFISNSAWAQVNLFAKARIEMTVMQHSLHFFPSVKEAGILIVEQNDSHLVLDDLSLQSMGLLHSCGELIQRSTGQTFIYLFIICIFIRIRNGSFFHNETQCRGAVPACAFGHKKSYAAMTTVNLKYKRSVTLLNK